VTVHNTTRYGFLFALLPLVTATNVRAEAPPDDRPSGGATHAGSREATTPQKADHEHKLDFLHLKAETGVEYVGLETLSVKRNIVPFSVRRGDTGLFGGASAGVKLLFLSLGPHFRMAHFRDWDLWTLNLNVQWLAPLGKIEPYVMLSGGYARLGHAFDSTTNNPSVRVMGYDLRLVLGGDYFVTQNVSIGASLSGEMLGMHRAGVDLNAQDGLVNDLYKFDGASAGLGITGALGVGLHL